jgi:hypothetical protein
MVSTPGSVLLFTRLNLPWSRSERYFNSTAAIARFLYLPCRLSSSCNRSACHITHHNVQWFVLFGISLSLSPDQGHLTGHGRDTRTQEERSYCCQALWGGGALCGGVSQDKGQRRHAGLLNDQRVR